MEFMLMESSLKRDRNRESFYVYDDELLRQDTKQANYKKIKSTLSDSDASSIQDIFEDCFSSGNESSDDTELPSLLDNDEKFLLYNFDLVPEQNMPLNTTKMEIEKSLRCPNHRGKIALPWDINNSSVMKLDDVIAVRHDRMMVTTASKPFHIEWANAAWSQYCGWSLEEIVGLDCKFMQGMGTDSSVLKVFMEMLENSGGFGNMTIINYSKYHKVIKNTIHCFPISDNCGYTDPTNITHLGVVLLESVEIDNPSVCDELVMKNPNLQYDRRVQSERYPYVHSTPAPKPVEWISLAKDFTISLMLRYMMRSQAPIVILDSYGQILSTNIAVFELTRFRHAEIESVSILDMIGKKSKQSDVKKLSNMFQSYEEEEKGFKRPISTKSLTNLELFLKHRPAPIDIPNAFEDYVRPPPSKVIDESEPCEFCAIYDHNEAVMKVVVETTPVYASVVRFNSQHIAIMFSERNY